MAFPIRIVREYQRIVLFRVGRCVGTRGPGVVFLLPFMDRPLFVDLRELYLEIPQQTAITKDNAPISIDFIIFYRVIDAVESVVKVQNFAGAAQNIAATTLRSVVGDMSLDDVLSKRDEMNLDYRGRRREAGCDSVSGGRPAGGDLARRGLLARAGEDLRGRSGRRSEHDAVAVPGRPQGDRHVGFDEVRSPARSWRG